MNQRLNITIILFVISLLVACGEKEQQVQDQGATQSMLTKSPLSQPNKGAVEIDFERSARENKSYHMAESFNVGDDVYVRSIAVNNRENTILVGTSLGIVEVDMKSRNMLNTYTRDHGLANEYVFGMIVDDDGTKWFGTNGGGISSLKDGQWKTYFPMHGLADYWVYAFTQQANGTLWIGTWAGLNKYDKSTQKFTTYFDELVNEWVYGLDVDSKDRVWVGTEGGINMFDGTTWHTWTHKDGLGAKNEDNLPISSNTGLGTRSRHDLSVMEQGSITYNPNYVFTLLIDKDDTLWAGTWGGGVSRYDGKQWVNYTTKEGIAGNIVFSVAQDNTGVLWFGSNGGLSRYDGKQWETYTKADGLLDNSVYAIGVTEENDIWVGSRSGVVLLQKKQ